MRVDDPLGAVSFTQEFINVGDIDFVAAALPNAPQSGSTFDIETMTVVRWTPSGVTTSCI